eukprot:6162951-Amphidinium_carterae.1
MLYGQSFKALVRAAKSRSFDQVDQRMSVHQSGGRRPLTRPAKGRSLDTAVRGGPFDLSAGGLAPVEDGRSKDD